MNSAEKPARKSAKGPIRVFILVLCALLVAFGALMIATAGPASPPAFASLNISQCRLPTVLPMAIRNLRSLECLSGERVFLPWRALQRTAHSDIGSCGPGSTSITISWYRAPRSPETTIFQASCDGKILVSYVDRANRYVLVHWLSIVIAAVAIAGGGIGTVVVYSRIRR